MLVALEEAPITVNFAQQSLDAEQKRYDLSVTVQYLLNLTRVTDTLLEERGVIVD